MNPHEARSPKPEALPNGAVFCPWPGGVFAALPQEEWENEGHRPCWTLDDWASKIKSSESGFNRLICLGVAEMMLAHRIAGYLWPMWINMIKMAS